MSEEFEEFQKLSRQKRYRDAAALAERQSMRGTSPDPFWMTQQAVALLRAGDAERALAVSRKALAANPSDPYAVVSAADSLFALDKSEEALVLYLEVQRHPKLSPRARKGVLECLARLKRWEEALSRLTEWALPEEEGAPWKVKILAGLGRREEALAECHRWLERAPEHPPVLWALTELEVERDGMEAVLERLGRTVRIPSIPQVYREIYASLCRRAGRPEAALAEYEKLGAQGGGSRVQKRQAFLLAKSGKEREAIPLLEELLRAEPADMYLHSSYEAACRRIGETERAINFYSLLLGQHPEAKSLHGRIRRLRGSLEKGPLERPARGSSP
jgi:tetratricopeptide (TPR) repeat protein